MLDRLRRFITDFGSAEPTEDPDAHDTHVAAAALLVHALAADGEVSEGEREALLATLQREYGLSATGAAELLAEAKLRDDEAVDLYGFTSVLKRRLDETERQRLIAVMWELVMTDGSIHEIEDNIIWRVAELLGVSTRDRVRLRKEIEAEREG